MSDTRRAPECPYCDGRSVLASSAEVYGGRDYGPIYLCRPCDAYVGCHPGTTKPLGRLANAELRQWKQRAHAAFDPLWKRGSKQQRFKRRRDAYAWLANNMGLSGDACHIGMFNVTQCKQVVDLCKVALFVTTHSVPRELAS